MNQPNRFQTSFLVIHSIFTKKIRVLPLISYLIKSSEKSSIFFYSDVYILNRFDIIDYTIYMYQNISYINLLSSLIFVHRNQILLLVNQEMKFDLLLLDLRLSQQFRFFSYLRQNFLKYFDGDTAKINILIYNNHINYEVIVICRLWILVVTSFLKSYNFYSEKDIANCKLYETRNIYAIPIRNEGISPFNFLINLLNNMRFPSEIGEFHLLIF